MKRVLILIVLLLSLPSWAAISRNGNCSAATTSCTFTGTATGSLKIIFAWNNGATIPTTPGTFTAIDSGTVNSGGNRISYKIGCNVSSSASDTGSGTWTSATDVVGASYAGVAAGVTTANCNTIGIGTFGHNNATGSTSMNYPTITLKNTDNTSWVFGGAGGSATSGTITCAPAGMTSIVTGGTGPQARASDTNTTASSWSSTSCTVASENWVTSVVEIKQHGANCTNQLMMTGAGC